MNCHIDRWACLDCGFDCLNGDEYYMLRDRVWLRANPDGAGMLCVGCVERRLFRRLRPFDFNWDAPVNGDGPWGARRSIRLDNRMRGHL
jgi:hypothetical protein